jgi:hypothetical protein
MKYTECFSIDEMTSYFCKKRIKLAKRRNRKHLLLNLTCDERYNYHCRDNTTQNEAILNSIMPPRRSWVKLGETNRYRDGNLIDSSQKNLSSLIFTIAKARKKDCHLGWLTELDKLIASIRKQVLSFSYQIKAPRTIPQPKDEKGKSGTHVCRPISLFDLTDGLVITQTNKYFTRLFDDYMLKYSFAFRMGKRTPSGKIIPIRHHNAFEEIIRYNKVHSNETIFVAECDMRKFFDTVNHGIVKRRFLWFSLRLLLSERTLPNLAAVRIFWKYLRCYTFHKCVYRLNSNKSHFAQYGISDGKYEWVDNQALLKHYSMKALAKEGIGIPQGGALSGFIANLVLDYADRKISKLDDGNLLYLRYCDDMIIMHPDKAKCEEVFKAYFESLKELKLIPHEPASIDANNPKSFWTSKTKEPYAWDEDHYRWITFVGYDICKNGDIRVRKKSLEKEMKKQKEIVDEVLKAVSRDRAKAGRGRIAESAINRLVGMSVGRVNMRTYEISPAIMCWASGFKLLNDNRTSRYQLRILDRNRNIQIRRLIHGLTFIAVSKEAESTNKRKAKQLIYYGKPFSYYYSIIEKPRK